MRIKRTLTLLLTFGTAFALTPTAGAQEAVTPKFSFACAGLCPGGAPDAHEQFLHKDVYAPGEKIRIHIGGAFYKCQGPATSEGFTAPAVIKESTRHDGVSLVGETRAGKVPGAYQVRIDCTGGRVVDTFTIKASSPGKPKPKPPVVKPKGAPDTGGGGTAR